MAKLKRISNKTDCIFDIIVPVSDEELLEREKNYTLLPDIRFATKYRNVLFQLVTIKFKGKKYITQMNSCINPYCENFGMPQVQYEVKGKPKRYKLGHAQSNNFSRLVCNPGSKKATVGVVWGCNNYAVSNWAISEEIRRLAEVNLVLL